MKGSGKGIVPPNFLCFNFWATLQYMLEALFAGRQTEQLLLPGIPARQELSSGYLLERLYPASFGMVDPSHSPPQLFLIRRTTLHWVTEMGPDFVLPGDPTLWCPFMLYITLPSSVVNRTLQRAFQTGSFTLDYSEVPDAVAGCMNLSFSPRSALLFASFQLSIAEIQTGQRRNFEANENFLTVGFRLLQSTCATLFLDRNATIWNRRHIDFLLRCNYLQVPWNPHGFTFMVLDHRCNPYFLRDELNRYFEVPGVPHFRMMHVPTLWSRHQELQHFPEEGIVPLGHFLAPPAQRSRL